MAYLVNLTARAERDLALLYLQINAEDSGAALKWYRGAILSLEGRPNRCPVTPESDKLRHLLYGNKPHIYLPRNLPRAGSRSRLKCRTSDTAQGAGSKGPMSNRDVPALTRGAMVQQVIITSSAENVESQSVHTSVDAARTSACATNRINRRAS
jgi:toxin ParE1/3/4